MFTNLELMSVQVGLKKFALKLTGTSFDADDLTQATILRMLEKKHLYKAGTNLFSWGSKVMFNVFASQYRRKKKFETQYDPDDFISKLEVFGGQENSLYLKQVLDRCKDLNEDQNGLSS